MPPAPVLTRYRTLYPPYRKRSRPPGRNRSEPNTSDLASGQAELHRAPPLAPKPAQRPPTGKWRSERPDGRSAMGPYQAPERPEKAVFTPGTPSPASQLVVTSRRKENVAAPAHPPRRNQSGPLLSMGALRRPLARPDPEGKAGSGLSEPRATVLLRAFLLHPAGERPAGRGGRGEPLQPKAVPPGRPLPFPRIRDISRQGATPRHS